MEKRTDKSGIDQARLDLYDRLIQTQPNVQRYGKGMPSTSVNGNRFSFLSPTGSLFLRLPEKEKENFIRKYKSAAKAQGNSLIEYVEVPEKVVKDFEEIKRYFAISFAHAMTLKSK